MAPAAHPEMATAKHNPMGNARAFLDAAREGKFSSGRRGREVVAPWNEVLAHDRARVRPRTVKPAPLGTDAAREKALREHGAL